MWKAPSSLGHPLIQHKRPAIAITWRLDNPALTDFAVALWQPGSVVRSASGRIEVEAPDGVG